MTLVNVLNIIGIFLRDVMMIINYLVFGKYFLKCEIKKSNVLISFLTFILAVIAISGELYIAPWDNGDYGIVTIFSTIMYIVAIFTLSKGIPKWQFVLLAFCYTGIVDMTYTYFEVFLPKERYVECIVYVVVYAIITAFILYSVEKAPTNIFPEALSTIPKWMFWALIIFCFARYYNEAGDWSEFSRILTPISAIGIVCCIIYFMYKIFILTYKQNEILKQMHYQKEYSEKILTNDENLRRFRHDYRNHMIVINSLLESGRTDRAREYLNNMNNDISSTLTKISTGNFISDAIINNKAVAAAEHGVSIRFTGQVIPEGIADEDLCIVLANILDNAIEATKKLNNNKTIHIDAALRNGFFIMNVSNPVENEVKIRKDGTIKTSKKIQSEHGFGIKNVQKAVKKYGGKVSVICENKAFSVDIMMKPTL